MPVFVLCNCKYISSSLLTAIEHSFSETSPPCWRTYQLRPYPPTSHWCFPSSLSRQWFALCWIPGCLLPGLQNCTVQRHHVFNDWDACVLVCKQEQLMTGQWLSIDPTGMMVNHANGQIINNRTANLCRELLSFNSFNIQRDPLLFGFFGVSNQTLMRHAMENAGLA